MKCQVRAILLCNRAPPQNGGTGSSSQSEEHMQRLIIQGGQAHGSKGQAGDTGPHVPDYGAWPPSLAWGTSTLNQMISSSCKTTILYHLGAKPGPRFHSEVPQGLETPGSQSTQSRGHAIQGLGHLRSLQHILGARLPVAPPMSCCAQGRSLGEPWG